MNNSPYYRTSDLYYAAYLCVMGVRFVECLNHDGRVWFLFDPHPKNREFKRAYFVGESEVPVQQYVKAIRTLKVLLHQTRFATALPKSSSAGSGRLQKAAPPISRPQKYS